MFNQFQTLHILHVAGFHNSKLAWYNDSPWWYSTKLLHYHIWYNIIKKVDISKSIKHILLLHCKSLPNSASIIVLRMWFQLSQKTRLLNLCTTSMLLWWICVDLHHQWKYQYEVSTVMINIYAVLLQTTCRFLKFVVVWSIDNLW